MPRAVADIAKALPISRPAVSQHLKILKEAGLITVRRAGTRNVYAANLSELALLRAHVERFWRDALASYKHHIQAEEQR